MPYLSAWSLESLFSFSSSQVLLRVKENELRYLKKEVQCLKDELQMMQKVPFPGSYSLLPGGSFIKEWDVKISLKLEAGK